MNRRVFSLGLLTLPVMPGQEQVELVCPMDPDVRSAKAGRCPRCGMILVAGGFDTAEYPVSLRLRPATPRPGESVELSLTVQHPKTGSRVTEFEPVHEKMHHLFI